MRVAELLQTRLKNELGLVVGIPSRTYASSLQLESWAWSWAARGQGGMMVGSTETMTACVKAGALTPLSQKRSGTLEVMPTDLP